MDPKFNVLQQLHRESASINGTLKSSRKLLMDAISSNCCGNNRINSSNNTGMFHTLDKIQSSKIEPKATKLLDTRSTVSEETNARICREDTQKLSTHREDLKMKKLDREEERISQSIQSPKTRMADCRKESDEKSVAQPCSVDHHFDIGVGAGVDLSCKFKHTGNGTIRSDDYDDDGIRPQKQSSLSSAMLSLPMNATSSPLMSSCNDDDDNKHDSILESQIQVGNLNNRKSPVSVEEGRSVADPLTDIEYWQGIVEEEKRKTKNGDSKTTFRHALASIVLARNSIDGNKKKMAFGSNSNSSRSSHDEGFRGGLLWLPSILEGGMNHIGLVDDKETPPTGHHNIPITSLESNII
mmetsp:Transcript_27187/g.59859  ORF Transcript_27187/g.59859 Transcript_27187/m.59859 type:complete len:354 (+) Transcript_27187:949-2010(+)